jgi:hypothetical protein
MALWKEQRLGGMQALARAQWHKFGARPIRNIFRMVLSLRTIYPGQYFSNACMLSVKS